MSRPAEAALALALLVLTCATGAAPAPDAGSPRIQEQLIASKRAIMDADYRADLAALSRERTAAARLESDPAFGALAHYWAGYASWRVALNGANAGMDHGELVTNLTAARVDFERAAELRPSFADALAAGASVNGWLASLRRDDAPAMKGHLDRMRSMLSRARALEPDNPRVLWVGGGNDLFTPPQFGGDRQRAIRAYRHAVEVGRPSDPRSPLPDWGVPESWMALAFAHMTEAEPDLDGAATEAAKALSFIPEWHYVKAILIPQIEAARKNR